jgi:hypothetical protein
VAEAHGVVDRRAERRVERTERGGARDVSWLRVALLAVWEFVVGDDWRTAAGVVLALALTAAVAAAGVPAWWVTPVVVIGVLALSIRRALRLK